MNTPSPEDRVRVLESYFVGRTDAYALQQNDGNYRVYKRTLDSSILNRHTTGELTVAAFLLSPEGTPVGVFDIDTKGGDTQKLIKVIVSKSQELELSCLVEPSGRKGYHLWFIFKNMLDAGLVRHFLIRLLESCHPSGRVPMDIEIFPKQSSTENLGNAIKLPFGVHKRTGKRTLFINANDFTPMDDWGISAIDKSPPIDLERIKIALGELGTSAEAEKRASGASRDIPRHKGMLLCYPKMDAGVPEGQRDEVMFRRAVHFRDQGYEEKIAHEALLQINQRNRPPMEKKEIAAKIKQAFAGRPYSYGCNNPVIAQFCDPNCPVYNRRNEPGVGKDLEEWQDDPTVLETSDIPHNMRIIPTVPPYYDVAVREKWITVDWEEITTPTAFANSVHRQGKGLLNIPWKKPRWTKHIQGLMREADKEYAPQNTSEWYEVVDLLYQWLQGTPPAEDYESIPEGRPMLRDGKWYFQGTDATLQLKNRFRLLNMSTGKLWAAYVQRLGGNSHRVTLEDGKRLDLWYVPQDRAPIGPPEEKEEDDSDFWGTEQPDKDFWGVNNESRT